MDELRREDAGKDVLGRGPAERLWSAVKLVAIIVAVLWAVEVADQLVFDGRLDRWGIRPRSLGGLWGILAAPFLHGGFVHLLANTPPLAVLSVLILVLRGAGSYLGVTVAVTLGSGLGVWLTGGSASVHIGASGVIFGWLGFLLLAGLVERRLTSLLATIVVAALYSGLLWGVLPSGPGISWEGHLFGFLSGLGTAWLGRPRRLAAARTAGR